MTAATPSRPVWHISQRAPDDYLAALAPIHPLVAQVLFARGFSIEGARAFFSGDERDSNDPFALTDMRAAVDRIRRAIAGDESIAIYGDYDCDGVTACALMHEVLTTLGARTRVYIPDRFEEGYGLNKGALDTLKAEGHALVVTVDCGARAIAEAHHAKTIGLDLVITDHHAPEPDGLPDALAVVNPNRPGDAYAFKQLAGVGVAYQLARALMSSMDDEAEARPVVQTSSLLDLVAIGTVADVVALTGENRALVREGLRRINTLPRAGVRALMAASGARAGAVTAQTIGFTLGPRLNAAGRLDTARSAYELLATDNADFAASLAEALNDRNSQRQNETAHVAKDAEQRALENARDADGRVPILFAASPAYNAGVIGLAASRLMDKFHAPAIVVTVDERKGEARGSCRSVSGFHITDALDECKPLLLRHGGHEAAAGFTTRVESLETLRAQLTDIARAAQPADGWTKTIHIDAVIVRDDALASAYAPLQQLEPHGMSNDRPTFAALGARVVGGRKVGRAEAGAQPPHMQLRVKLAKGMWDCIGFRMGERLDTLPPGATIDLAFQLDMNEWNGNKRLQLVIVDVRPSS